MGVSAEQRGGTAVPLTLHVTLHVHPLAKDFLTCGGDINHIERMVGQKYWELFIQFHHLLQNTVSTVQYSSFNMIFTKLKCINIFQAHITLYVQEPFLVPEKIILL